MAVGLMLVLFSYSSAQVPQMINYQGKLTDPSGAPVNDTVQMVFSIYVDEGGATLLWTETQTAVITEKGVFNVLLGSANPIPDSVFDGSVRYLGVKVGDDPEITPRKQIVSVPYAYKSLRADSADYSLKSTTAETAVVVLGPPDLTGMDFHCTGASSVYIDGSGYFCMATGHCKWYCGVNPGTGTVTISVGIDGVPYTYSFSHGNTASVGGQDIEGSVCPGLWKFNWNFNVSISFSATSGSPDYGTASYSISWWK